MSKAHDPHWRYIALRLDGDRAVSRRSLQNALLGRARKEDVADADAPQLTRYAWPHAIVKVHHHQMARARDWLPRVDFAVDGDRVALTVQTLGASGTIRSLTERLGILDERGPAKDTRPSKAVSDAQSRRPAPAKSPAGGPARPPSRGPVAPPRRTRR